LFFRATILNILSDKFGILVSTGDPLFGDLDFVALNGVEKAALENFGGELNPVLAVSLIVTSF
jgi:hypothetical protein